MYTRIFVMGAVVALGTSLSAQTIQRRANMVNGGSRDEGRCTVEVSVDGSAEVAVHGGDATLRNTQGQPAQWRRFECNAPLPPDPVNLRLEPRAGRGRQDLVSDPRSGGAAVVQIQDPGNGADIYAFDLQWGNTRGDRRDDRGSFEGPGPRFPDRDRRFTADQAVRVCQDSIRDQAVRRFGTQNVDFPRTSMDDNPGRNDRVVGELAVHKRFGRQDIYRFDCSVNFDTGAVRAARIDQFERSNYPDYNRR